MNEKERKEEGCGQTFVFVSDNYFSFEKKLRSNITFF
jgi:hypothetical protein